MKTILLLIMLLFIPIFFYAENDIDSGLRSGYILGRFNVIDEILQYKKSAEESHLFYEKAVLINIAYKPGVGLTTMTEGIMKAIELVPDNKDYKGFLREKYTVRSGKIKSLVTMMG